MATRRDVNIYRNFLINKCDKYDDFLFGIYDIPRKIQEGELDYYITKPLDPLFRLTFENINIGSSPLILASILIVLYGISELNSEITLVMIIIYIFMVLLMTLLL